MSRELELGIVYLCAGIVLVFISVVINTVCNRKALNENKWLREQYKHDVDKYVAKLKEKDIVIENQKWDMKGVQQEYENMEEYLDTLTEEHRHLREKHRHLREECEMLKSGIPTRDIKKIIHNKKATIVWFKDGNKVIVKPAKGEKGDVYNAVAYATMKNIYGNNSQFKKYVDERVVKE